MSDIDTALGTRNREPSTSEQLTAIAAIAKTLRAKHPPLTNENLLHIYAIIDDLAEAAHSYNADPGPWVNHNLVHGLGAIAGVATKYTDKYRER